MKKILILSLILIFSAVGFAQPPNARLDADIKRLNRRFENVESIKRKAKDANSEVRLKRAIDSAQRALERFIKKHQNHDVSKYKRALAEFKNPTSSSSVSDFAKVENLVETVEEILEFNLDPRGFIRKEKDALEKAKKKLENFRDKMEKILTTELLTLAKDSSNRKIARISDKANRAAGLLETEFSRTDTKTILKETNQYKMMAKYLKVLSNQEKLSFLSKIFGNKSAVKTANDSANRLIANLGTIDEIERQGEKNYAAKVAKHRMFPERQKSPVLKNQAKRAFVSSIWNKGKSNQVLKVRIVGGGWSITRNKVTGIIISRDQQAQIAYKANDGKCYTYLMLMEQKHQGGGRYGRAYDRSGSTQEILCANVPK